MTMWETITQAQARKQTKAKHQEGKEEIQIEILENGWYEGYVSYS